MAKKASNKKPTKRTAKQQPVKFNKAEEPKKQVSLWDRVGKPDGQASDSIPMDVKTEGEQRSDPISTSSNTIPPASIPTTSMSGDDLSQPSLSSSCGSEAVTPRLPSSTSSAPKSGEPKTGLGKLLKASIQQQHVGPHVEVRALAGTGKTTCVMGGVMKIKGVNPGITPSDQQAEVWKQLGIGRSDSVRLSAFNSTITDELKKRVEANGLQHKGVEARGVHSLGLQAVTKALGRMQANDWCDRDAVAEALGGNWQDLLRTPGMAGDMQASASLVSLCKQTMTEPSLENLEDLASHYDVDVDRWDRVTEVVEKVLEAARQPKGRISFDDMIWLPLVLGLPIPKVDVQVIDEAQDLNRMQQELIYLAGRRIVFVGDPHQAIYGFAGADAESMPRMFRHLSGFDEACEQMHKDTLNGIAGTEKSIDSKCLTLPLTVTRRCGKAIVEEARKIVPEFEAHEGNHAGLVREMLYPIVKDPTSGTWKERKWEETYCKDVRGGDRIICRVNAPLVSQCFRFLRRGIPAVILGRQVGQGLTSMVRKSKADTVAQLVAWVENWLDEERAKESRKKRPSEDRMIALQDRADCLLCFCEGSETVGIVERKIEDLFTDKKDRPGVLLSSIHKSKGLEAERVFFLQPKGAECPHPMAKSVWQRQQESNLRYVGITRAIKELIHVY